MSDARERIREHSRRLRATVIEHVRHKDVLDTIHTNLLFGDVGQIQVVVGPAGVGITHAIRALRTLLLKESAQTSLYYATSLDAQPPDIGTFHWKGFWKAGLEALHSPVIGQRRRATESESGLTEFTQRSQYRSGQEYRSDFENALRQRGTRYVLVDHCQHMLTRGRPGAAGEQLQTLASMLRDEHGSPAHLIVAGSYDILAMLNKDPSLDRIAHRVHVAPYDVDSEDDVQQFAAVLRTYELELGTCCREGLLVQRGRELCEASAGCIGWLRGLLFSALCHMVQDRKSTLAWRHVAKALPRRRERDLLQEQIRTGLAWLEDEPATRSRKEPRLIKRRVGHRRVGERNPSRDPVGDDE